MQEKTVNESSIVMAHSVMPQDANTAGNAHGGVIMKLIDEAGAAAALRHAGLTVVTASIDRLDFHNPVHIGQLVFLKASLNMAGRTSMEVGVRVEAENPRTGQVWHTASAYLTFVALDEYGRPTPVPPLHLETEEEKRRHREALARREMRLAEKEREKGG